MKKFFLGSLLFFFVSLNLNAAGTWEEIFRAMIDQETGNETIESGKQYSGNLYSAKIKFIINDGDGNPNNFTDDDNIQITVNDTLSFNGNKEGLINWAKANGSELYKSIFPSGPSGEATGTTDSQFLQGTFASSILLRQVESPSIFNFNASIQLDYSKVGTAEEKTKAFTLMPSYSFSLGENYQHSFGFLLPMKYAEQEGKVDTKFLSTSLIPYFKYNVYDADTLFMEGDTFSVDVGVNALLHATFISSVMLRGAGNFKYGGSLFSAAQWDFEEYFSVRLGLSYQISKSYFPDSIVKEEMRWLVDVINDLPIDQELSAGINFTFPVYENFRITLDYLRTHSLNSKIESGKANVSTIGVFFNYVLFDLVELNVGYKKIFEVEDLEQDSIVIGGIFRF